MSNEITVTNTPSTEIRPDLPPGIDTWLELWRMFIDAHMPPDTWHVTYLLPGGMYTYVVDYVKARAFDELRQQLHDEAGRETHVSAYSDTKYRPVKWLIEKYKL